jgi:hypothetical protein
MHKEFWLSESLVSMAFILYIENDIGYFFFLGIFVMLSTIARFWVFVAGSTQQHHACIWPNLKFSQTYKISTRELNSWLNYLLYHTPGISTSLIKLLRKWLRIKQVALTLVYFLSYERHRITTVFSWSWWGMAILPYTSRLGGRLRFINSTGLVNAGMSNGYQCI